VIESIFVTKALHSRQTFPSNIRPKALSQKHWFIRKRAVPFHLEIAHPPGACPFCNVAYLGLPFVLLTSSSILALLARDSAGVGSA
jgi:hypothetical protein